MTRQYTRKVARLSSSVRLDAVREVARDLAALQRRRVQLTAEIARIGSESSRAAGESLKAEEALKNGYVLALLEGREPPAADAALVAKIKAGENVVGASAAARHALEFQLGALDEQIAVAEAKFSGSVFDLVTDFQEEARAEFLSHWMATAPALARLLALEDVRRRFCDGSMMLTGTRTYGRPWSGSAAVEKLIAGLPEKLASPSTGIEHLRTLAVPIAQSLILEVEGE